MVFWDEMWNLSAEEFKNLGTLKPKEESCCGDWDREGKCKCIKKTDNEK